MTQLQIKDSQIRKTAFLLWLDEGQPHGRDQEHWQKAIEVLSAPAPKAKPAAKAKAKAPAKAKSATKAAAATSKAKAAPATRKPRVKKATKAAAS